MKILILGHTGMLGHMVHKYLTSKLLNVETTQHRWPSQEFKEYIKDYDGDFIINCIGAIHQKTNNFDVNWELPIFLDFYSQCKIIHKGTECEMDDDNYGTSKQIARDYDVLTGEAVALRGTFLIDQQGYVRHQLVNDLPLGRNVEETIRMVDALKFYQENGEVCPANWSKGKKGMKANSKGVAEYLEHHASIL